MVVKDLRQFGNLYKNIVAENKKYYESCRKANMGETHVGK